MLICPRLPVLICYKGRQGQMSMRRTNSLCLLYVFAVAVTVYKGYFVRLAEFLKKIKGPTSVFSHNFGTLFSGL